MSPSSGGSKPSSESSSAAALEPPAGEGFVARLERAVAPLANRIAEAPAVRALQETLPLAFVVMIVVLSLRLARRLRFPAAALLAAAASAFVLALPRDALAALERFARTRVLDDLGPFARTLGVSGVFTAIVIALGAAGAIALGRRRFGAGGRARSL